jgi:Flp pilus assembly pilin Flp
MVVDCLAARAHGSREPGSAAWALGQGVVEFGLILAIAAVVAVVAIAFFGPQLAEILDLIGTQLERPA